MTELTRQYLAKINERACAACKPVLVEVIKQRALSVSYRPVVSLGDGSLFGNLASVDGPEDAAVRSMDRMFGVAFRLGEMVKLSKRYLEAVLLGFADSGASGRLLLPVPAKMTEELDEEWGYLLEKTVRKSSLERERLILIHPGIISDFDNTIRKSVAFAEAVRRQGLSLGAGAFGCERSETLLWKRVAPEITLLDENQFEGANLQVKPLPRLEIQIAEASARQRLVLARGISTVNQLKAAAGVGVTLVCGDLIGKPGVKPTTMISASALKVLNEICPGESAEFESDFSGCFLSKLLTTPPVATADTTSEEVFQLFDEHPDLRAVAVVQGESPLGLISRYEMVDNMARPYRHELYGRKSCVRFMDSEALSADIRTDLADLTDLVSNAPPRHLIIGFIITDRGRYLGMGSVQDLMREVTVLQLDAARYANPLTQLPGNVPINNTIDGYLSARIPFTVAYSDLDHFKPVNDVLGYAKGDALIVLTARILADACDPDLDFVGHIGGDDFVLILRSPDWETRCRHALERFERETRAFFPEEILRAGGIEAENRNGKPEFFPLTTLSIGAAEIPPGIFQNHLEVVAVVTEAKKKAKSMPHNSLYINQRRY